MTLLKSSLSHFFHKSTPVIAADMSLEYWRREVRMQTPRFVQRVEMCTALAAGQDAWGSPVDKTHHHTLLRVVLVPTPGGPSDSEDTMLIERVFSTGGACHSVTPITEKLSTGGTLFHPDVHDRVCVISDGPSTALAHDLEVERTLEFGYGSSQPSLTLAQFAQIIDFVSRMTMLICAGGLCKLQSRSFAFTCLAALTPSLPRPTLVRNANEGSDVNGEDGAEVTDDSVFELNAEVFLGHLPWLVNDLQSVQALRLIGEMKENQTRGRATARLYH